MRSFRFGVDILAFRLRARVGHLLDGRAGVLLLAAAKEESLCWQGTYSPGGGKPFPFRWPSPTASSRRRAIVRISRSSKRKPQARAHTSMWNNSLCRVNRRFRRLERKMAQRRRRLPTRPTWSRRLSSSTSTRRIRRKARRRAEFSIILKKVPSTKIAYRRQTHQSRFRTEI